MTLKQHRWIAYVGQPVDIIRDEDDNFRFRTNGPPGHIQEENVGCFACNRNILEVWNEPCEVEEN